MKQKLKYIIFIGILSILELLFIPNEVNAATYKDNETGITWYYGTSGYNAVNVYISSKKGDKGSPSYHLLYLISFKLMQL